MNFPVSPSKIDALEIKTLKEIDEANRKNQVEESLEVFKWFYLPISYFKGIKNRKLLMLIIFWYNEILMILIYVSKENMYYWF